MSTISIKDLVKTYSSTGEELCVLDGITLDIQGPGVFLIKGRSGSGKSTLLNLIGGLDTPSSGEITIQGVNPLELQDRMLSEFRNRSIGFVFQFHFLLRDFSALENVALPGFIAGSKKKEVLARAADLLGRVGLADRMEHLPGQLSGGERQRVAIARALINDPLLILADEPTGNLDEGSTGDVLSLLYDVTEQYGKTLLMVTHEAVLPPRGTVLHLEQGNVKYVEA